MKKKSTLLIIIFFCFFVSLSVVYRGMAEETNAIETIDNESIIKLAKAGLGEQIVIEKIKSSKTSFDLSTDSLIKLKENGVSGGIIEAMMQSQKPVSTPAGVEHSPPPSTAGQGTPQAGSQDIFSPNYQFQNTFQRGECENRLAEFLKENPDFDPGISKTSLRTGSFQLNAKSKVQVFGSLSERSAKCFSIKRNGRIDSYSGQTLVSFDGGMFNFHDFYDVGKNSTVGVVKDQDLGDSRASGIYIRDARVTTQIINPPPSERIIIDHGRGK